MVQLVSRKWPLPSPPSTVQRIQLSPNFLPTDSAIEPYKRSDIPAKVERVGLDSGKRELAKEITPYDRAGLLGGINNLRITSDGKAYAYSYVQQLSELQLVEGLK